MMVDDVALRAAFGDFARAVVGSYDADRMLHLLTGQVVGVLGVDGAGVSLAAGRGNDDDLRFATATSDDVRAVEDAQVELGQGPCHEAYRTGQVVAVSYLELEERWPDYRKVALDHGLRSVAGIPMPVSEVRIGALNLYRCRNHEWGREELETAQILADMASGYILHANRLDDERSRAEGLTQALQSRDVIGQAKGILMSRYRLSAEAAFELLRRVSQDRNIKLRELAAQVVETGSLPE
jgi:GAF domain-containing protein